MCRLENTNRKHLVTKSPRETPKMTPIAADDDKKRHIVADEPVPKKAHTKATRQPKISRRRYKVKDIDATSPLGILQYEIKDICAEKGLSEDSIANDMKLILNDKEVEQKVHRIVSDVKIEGLLSNGDGVAVIESPFGGEKKQIAVVPFGLPGDIVEIRVFKSHPNYVEADLLAVTAKSEARNDDLITCKYFGKCSGCQYQNVDYSQQLLYKKKTIENAYKFLAPVLTAEGGLPAIDETTPSPLQYGYRTKLTPHFNLPNKPKEGYTAPALGFGAKGRPTWRAEVAGGSYSILDIEECSIGTDIINKGMLNERTRFHEEYRKYRKGATILLREDTLVGETEVSNASTDPSGAITKIETEQNGVKLTKTCVTNPKQIVTEYVNGKTFEFSAGEFFQNNNSILPAVTNYVKENLTIPNSQPDEPNYLIDAYCGSGLFSITCSDNVSRVIGVEVSADSVKFAERNAKNNKVENATFIVGKAEALFGNIDTPATRTSVILDPPRKGCDEVFLNQLSDYNPARIVYISCNVHSQARDVDWFINKTENGRKYRVESIRGFDFFPQTHHVESVAVLTLK